MSDYSTYIDKYPVKNGKEMYRVQFSFISPKDGKRHKTNKRGFEKKKDAQRWIKNDLPNTVRKLEEKTETKTIMTMDELIKSYCRYKNMHVRMTTAETKNNIINTKILPFFTGKEVEKIEPLDIVEWQEKMTNLTRKVKKTVFDENGKEKKIMVDEYYSETYLRTINNQLSAIFNYAVTIRKIDKSPCKGLEKIGSKKAPEREIWEPEEFEKFIHTQEYAPLFYYAFRILFWTGVRESELLCIELKNIDFKNNCIYVKDGYHKVKGKVEHGLKNKESYRPVMLPSFLSDELKDLVESLHISNPKSRIFDMSKTTLLKHLHDGAAEAGVKDICVHCLRHSYISLCVNNGLPYTTIQKQVGHSEYLQTVYYSHSIQNSGEHLVNALNKIYEG